MEISKLQILRFISNQGGEVDSYPITEVGAYGVLCELVDSGLVTRTKVEESLDLFKVTEKGLEILMREEEQQISHPLNDASED